MRRLRRKQIGGTPVSEGVRIEMERYTVFAVRNLRKDVSMRVRREPKKVQGALMYVPLLRGIVRMLHIILRFFDGIAESHELHPQRPVRGTKVEQFIATLLRVTPQSIVTLVSAICVILLSFILLYVAPEGAKAFIANKLTLTELQATWIVSAIRIASILFALAFVCRLRVLKRLTMYKGALNKVINCYEANLPLNIESAQTCSFLSRKSDGAFLMLTLIVSLLLFPFVPVQGTLMVALSRLAVILVVAAVINEPVTLLENVKQTRLVCALRLPSRLLQHITTLDAHPQMLEVALCAIKAALGEGDIEVNE